MILTENVLGMSWREAFLICGDSGWAILLLTLALICLFLKLGIQRTSIGSAAACSVLSLIPLAVGLLGTCSIAMKAFSMIGTSGLMDMSRTFSALYEVLLPLKVGLVASALTLSLSLFVWLRVQRSCLP
jgi:hypothetical protein